MTDIEATEELEEEFGPTPVEYDHLFTAREVVVMIHEAMSGKAEQWETEAAVERTKAAGDRSVSAALDWGAKQLRTFAAKVADIPDSEVRIADDGIVPFEDVPLEEKLIRVYREGFDVGHAAGYGAAVEFYAAGAASVPFVPNEDILRSNAEESGEPMPPGTEFVAPVDVVENDGEGGIDVVDQVHFTAVVVEPGSDADPFTRRDTPDTEPPIPLGELTAQIEAVEQATAVIPTEPVKRGPGRPKKNA